MAEKIEFQLKVIDDKLSVALEQNEKRAKSLGSAINVAIGSFAAAGAIKGISLLSSGFRELTSFVSDSVKAASESQDSLNQLNLALSQSGILTEESTKKFQAFAEEIQNTTAYEDDAVISTLAYIQALARLDEDGLQRATKAALDLSSALGIDLETAATIIGRASEGSTASLQKLGIQFEKGKSQAETFSNILTTLEKRFGGSAEAQVKTFSGAVAQLSNVFNSLQENVGNIIIKNPAVIAGFKTLNTLVISLADTIGTAFGGSSGDAIASFFNLILDGTNAVVLTVDATARVFNILANSVFGAFATIQASIVGASAGILNLLALIPGVGEKFSNAAKEATDEFNLLAQSVQGNIQSINDSFSGETFLSKFSLGIAEAKNTFNVFYADVKNKQDDLNKNTGGVDKNKLSEEELARVTALNNQLLEAEKTFLVSRDQLILQNQLEQDALFGAKATADLERLTQFELEKSQIQYEAALASANALKTIEETNAAKKKALADKELRDLGIKNKGLADIRKNDLDNQAAFFSAVSSLASSSNKELAILGKASAITEIAIRTPRAVAQSFEFGTRVGGPVLGAALGAIAATAMAAQAAKVAGIQGFANGGIIGATSGADNRIATVRDGEMILNADQQKSLFDMIKSGGNGGGDIVVQVDGREIARAVRTQLNNGFKFA